MTFSSSLLLTSILFIGLSSAVVADQFWLTTVVTEFRIRDECADFWRQSHACPAPLLRVATDVNRPTQFASRAWPIDALLASSEKPSFISQWHGSLESVRVSAQIEGSTALNPFGLVAKCDQGAHPKIAFNQSSLDVFERLSTRVVVVTSQCFTAKVLVRVDTECPYCPTTTTTTLAPTTSAAAALLSRPETLLVACSVMALVFVVCSLVFCVTLYRYLSLRRRRGFQQCPSLESGISTITVSSSGPSEEKPRDFFALLPPNIEYEELDLNESLTADKFPRLGSLRLSVHSLNVTVSEPIVV